MVVLLQADDRALRAGEFLHRADAAHDVRRVILHDLLVDAQERLALGAVGKDILGLAVDLHMGREACAAGAENTGVTDDFCKFHRLR